MYEIVREIDRRGPQQRAGKLCREGSGEGGGEGEDMLLLSVQTGDWERFEVRFELQFDKSLPSESFGKEGALHRRRQIMLDLVQMRQLCDALRYLVGSHIFKSPELRSSNPHESMLRIAVKKNRRAYRTSASTQDVRRRWSSRIEAWGAADGGNGGREVKKT
ncbi:hypothetical protein SCHPADRAFT_886693 [Schizopora paradoxa]|uniref:Uncharacterized protein n=1 Tax=Schizopora paradoxa TaxID=27342 RepID=A0A0H2S1K3_9AGAM|nr:hypothetical protein SCHPADRAFT_886693 [Schizopora paradoxa]